MSDEEELVFKRFPAEKQEQVRQLVSFATLMGLTGKDLVSIGGKLDRIKQGQDRKRFRSIVNDMDLKPVRGKSDKFNRDSWYFTTGGTKYLFKGDSWSLTITNTDTKAKMSFHNIRNWYYELGHGFRVLESTHIPRIMLNVWDGSIRLP